MLLPSLNPCPVLDDPDTALLTASQACHLLKVQLTFQLFPEDLALSDLQSHVCKLSQMANTKIRLIIFFAAKDGEALYSQQKQDWELTVA